MSNDPADLVASFNAAYRKLTASGAPFGWTIENVRGVPNRVFSAAPPDMRTVWEASAAHGAAEYLVYDDERYSYAEAHALVRSLAQRLHFEHGVGSGDRVAVAMRNYPEWVLSYWAITVLGAATVGMNAWWTSSEMEFALRDSSPKVLIVDQERLDRIQAHLDALRADETLPIIAVRCAGSLPTDAQHWGDVVSVAHAPKTLPAAEIDRDDDVCIFYTSGTTGSPKGAQLTHRGSVHNLMNMAFITVCGDTARAARQADAATAISDGRPSNADENSNGVDLQTAQNPESTQNSERTQPEPTQPEPTRAVVLLPVPLFHVTGCNCVLHPVTAAGAKLVLMYRWDPDTALRIIAREGVTNFTGVPTMSRELLQHPDWASTDSSSLASMGGGGAPLPPDLVKKIDEGLDSGLPVTGYGLTETNGIATAINNEYYLARPASVGPVVPCMEAKIVDGDGNELQEGAVGELALRGANVIRGYLDRPAESAAAIVDGWFHTGDIAMIDGDGWIHIKDRLKDVVIRGGENIHCSEVEAAIYEHPTVAEVCVFGVPDERLGEEVGAAVVLVPGTQLDAADLSAHLSGRMASFKHPRRVWFVDEPLPRNANGKFLKRELRETLLGAREP